MKVMVLNPAPTLKVFSVYLYVQCDTNGASSSCGVSTRCSAVPWSDGPAKASCKPRVCCGARRVQSPTESWIIAYSWVKMDAEV